MITTKTAAKAVGVGLVTGGLMFGLPAAMASADPLGDAVSNVVNGTNGAVQNVVNQNNSGLQGVTAINNTGLQAVTGINNTGLQAGVASLNQGVQSGGLATSHLINNTNNFVQFAVFGLLRPSG